MDKTRFIVIIGGVISGIGKGVATASIARILKNYGFSVTAVKIDPYINYDAGTLRPTEHGEVWVTNDGGEIDQDLGNYERFIGEEIPKKNNITTGQIYKKIIDMERKGEFLGETVQFIPHVPNEIKRRINESANGYDFCLIEVGGTVGDYENVPFLFAIKSLEKDIGEENLIYILITYLPIPDNVKEMKTKPTQQAIKMLSENGIFPDFILCRSREPLDSVRKKKIEVYANIGSEYVVSAPDIKSTIYSIPLNFEKENLGRKILDKFKINAKKEADWSKWKELVEKIENPKRRLKVGMIGKYVAIGNYNLDDSYISINEALKHAGAKFDVGIDIEWVDANLIEGVGVEILKGFDGIVVPGGFGSSGIEGKIKAIKYARENNIPFLGLCYGMQLAIVEFARNICEMDGANSTEIDPDTKFNVVDILPEQMEVKEKGGTMRLGGYAAVLKEGEVLEIYKKFSRLEKDFKSLSSLEKFRVGRINGNNIIVERHRHRYEVNPEFIKMLEEKGMKFPGYHERESGVKLMEFIELNKKFIATQSHPEFKSRLEDPAPLFCNFVENMLD